MAFEENPDEFLSADDFAKIATYNAADLLGIFDIEYAEGVGGAVGVAGYMKTFLVSSANIQSMATGDTITIDGIDFEVVNMEKDINEVFTKLFLMER